MTDQSKPSWQASDCPSWCIREHTEADVDSDRNHVSDPVSVPVIRLVRQMTEPGGVRRELVADEVLVALFQRRSDVRPWVSFGLADDGRVALDLPDESAERLAQALTAVLNEASR